MCPILPWGEEEIGVSYTPLGGGGGEVGVAATLLRKGGGVALSSNVLYEK